MATQNRYGSAVDGIVVRRRGGIVVVLDGEDTWVVPRATYESVEAEMGALPASADDEDGMPGHVQDYAELCRRVAAAGLVVSTVGQSTGRSDAERGALVRAAVVQGLVAEDHPLARRYSRA